MSSNIRTETNPQGAASRSGGVATRPLERAAPSIRTSLQQVLAAKPQRGSGENGRLQGDRLDTKAAALKDNASRVREEDLFAAAVHLQLSNKSTDLGAKFIAQFGATLSNMTRVRGSANLFKAADKVLRQIVRSGDVTPLEYRDIKAFAFGKAQLDQDRTEVAWTNLKDVPNQLGLGRSTPQSSADVDSALQKFESNTPASELELAIFKVKEAFNSLLVSLVRNQSTYQNSVTPPSRSRSTNTHSLSANHASHASANVSANASSPQAKSINAPSGFLWKPVSDSDGKLAILLPPALTSKAIGCKIISPNGSQVLATGRDGGVGNGDRQHYRFNAPGASFPPGSIVEIQLRDGSTIKIMIEDTGARLEGR